MTGYRTSGPRCRRIREAVCHHLEGRGLTRERVLAAAIRLIDLGFFRPGGEEYAEENGTFGLATIRKDHVTLSQGPAGVRIPGQGRQGPRAGGGRRSGVRGRAEPAAAARRRGPAARLPGRLALARRHQRRTSTTTSARYPGATTPPRTSAPGTRPSWPPWAWPCSESAAGHEAGRKRAIAGSSGRWPTIWAIPRPWPGPRTSTRASSSGTRKAARSPPRLASWARTATSVISTSQGPRGERPS